MSLIVQFSLLVTLVAQTYTGVALLLLARTTRRLPETALGISLSCAAVKNLTGIVIESVFPNAPEFIYVAIWGAFYASMAVTLFVGIWKVFRPEARAVGALAYGLAAMLAVVWTFELAGVNRRFYAGQWDNFTDHVLFICVFLTLIWGTIESRLYYHLMRRRIPLGLATPFTAHRFYMWSWAGLFWVGFHLAMILIRLEWLSRPVAQPLCALLALLGSLSLYFTFMPPRFWQRRFDPDLAT